jgi:hypothetical protein
MLIGGYLGEAGYINATLGFIIGMAGWVYILYEIFSGEAGKAASKSGNKALVTAFGAMRMIVTVGWAIYPLGYVFGYLTGGVDANSLNVVYNLADFINKIAFGLVIWAAAMSSAGAIFVRSLAKGSKGIIIWIGRCNQRKLCKLRPDSVWSLNAR